MTGQGEDVRLWSRLPIPLLELYYKKLYVHGIRAGFHLFEKGDVTFDARARIVFAGLDPDDSPALDGITERKSSIEGGFALDWSPGKYLLSATAFTDLLGRSGGQQVGLDLSRAWTFARYRWGLTPSIGVIWQSSDFVDYYVGVTPEEARPGRPPFQGECTVVHCLAHVILFQVQADCFDLDEVFNTPINLNSQVAVGSSNGLFAGYFGVLVKAENSGEHIRDYRDRIRFVDVSVCRILQHAFESGHFILETVRDRLRNACHYHPRQLLWIE